MGGAVTLRTYRVFSGHGSSMSAAADCIRFSKTSTSRNAIRKGSGGAPEPFSLAWSVEC